MPTVREATFDLFRKHGMTRMFGNPGSTELPMLQDFPDDFDYVLGLQEAAVVAMADGHAQVTGKPALVSGCIPMADYVAEAQCGEVVPKLSPDDLRAAIQRLMDHYAERQIGALARGRGDFALAPMLSAYGEVYAEAGA